MSELFDDEPGDVDTRRPGGRARALVITGVVLVVAFFALTTFASIYTDRLWYHEVGYGQVFSTMLWTRVGLFLVFGVFMGAAVAVNMYLAYRFRPLFRMPGGDGSVDRYRDAVTPIRTWLLAGVAIVVGIFAGTSAIGHWRSYLLWRHAEPFGQKDPYFDKDISFYVFSLPWWHYVVDFVMAATIVAILATAVVHYLYGGIRLQVPHDRLSGAAQVQFSALLGVFVLAKGVDYYLDRFDLVTDDHRLFTGMNYTGENALLPARNILMGVALICAVLFFLNIWRRTWQLPSVGLALLVLSAILLGMIWPAIVQNFQVKPTEADKEETVHPAQHRRHQKGVRHRGRRSPTNITAMPDGEADPTDGSSPARSARCRSSTRSRSSRPSSSASSRGSTTRWRRSSTSTATDPDRREMDETPLVLGVRELDQTGIDDSDRNWSNLHTVYTHGEGVIAAYANQVSSERGQRPDGVGRGHRAPATNVFSDDADFEPRIYYGEQSPTYSVVGKASRGRPTTSSSAWASTTQTPTRRRSSEDSKTTYDGEGGVDIGGTFRQLMYAIKFGEPNFLLSGRVNGNSKVLYNREPVDRVEKVAPWLTVDGDPYPAVVDGRIQWILDGYTTTDRYPNAAARVVRVDDRRLAAARTPACRRSRPTRSTTCGRRSRPRSTPTTARSPSTRGTRRTRSSSTWMKAFPDTVQPKAEIPDALMEHLRYPEDLFKVQRYQLARYHVTDAERLLPGQRPLGGPDRTPRSSNSLQPPYRLFTRTEPTSAASGR